MDMCPSGPSLRESLCRPQCSGVVLRLVTWVGVPPGTPRVRDGWSSAERSGRVGRDDGSRSADVVPREGSRDYSLLPASRLGSPRVTPGFR